MSRFALSLFCVLAALAAAVATGPAVRAAGELQVRRPTGFVYDEAFLRHVTGPGHPERPERLTAIVERLKRNGLRDGLLSVPPAADPLRWIETVHSAQYVARVKRSCEQGLPWLDSADTPICTASYDAAVAAVAGVLGAVDAVAEGRARNAFCAVRPPGHHARADRAMGFCLFNNVAVAARYVQKKHGLGKVLIADWDVHHGNGTQEAFYGDASVLYFSVHQHPFYPFTGTEQEKGAGEGAGLTINVPLPAGSGDAELVRAFEDQLKPAALAFRPDFVLVSAGFDGHEGDPIGGMRLTAGGYAALTRVVKEIAETCCNGRLVSVLEGGYNVEALAESVEAHIRVLME
jgi:acetoin utilization deacetylase AcuC-like enzyme